MNADAAASVNVPVYLTSFVGRKRELADLAQLVRDYRLVTLTGSGGVGKTRLAARAGASLGEAYRDGVWWVELAPLADAALVTEALLGALQVGDAPGRSALQRLTAHLATRELLVILDNCEHLLDACATLCDAVLRTCPGVGILATSREALRVGGEVTWQVPPLNLPANDVSCPVESLGSYDAVRLFIDRAVRARPNFTVTNATAPVVAEICTRLDGIPLAIELAAARTRVLMPQQILSGLQDRFRLLTGGARGLPRQQTLEASVAWSHDLLTMPERVHLRRLSVFAGGFTLDGAERVAASWGSEPEPAAVLDLLDALVAKSLVVVEDNVDDAVTARYRLLETIRAFAARELARAEETAPARDAHLRFCLESARNAEEALTGVTPALIRRCAAEQDNYRAALDWALAADDPTDALQLATRQGWLLLLRGRYREAHDALERALARVGGPPVVRSAALWMLGAQQWFLCDVTSLQASAAEALATARLAGDRRLEGRAHHLHVLLNLYVDPDAAKAAFTVALPLVEEAGDAVVVMDLVWDRGFIAMRADDTVDALIWLERALSLAHQYGSDWFQSWALTVEAVVLTRMGALPRGRAAAERAIGLARGLGEAGGVGFGTAILAEIELLAGAPERALALAEPSVEECTQAAAYVALPYLMTIQGTALDALGHPGARTTLEDAARVAAEIGDPWQHAQAALALARNLASAEDLPTADAACADAALAEARRCGALLGSPWVAAAADHVAGLLASALGEPARAEDLHQAALAVHADRGYPLSVVDCLEAIAVGAAGQQSWTEATRLLAATAGARLALGYRHGRHLTAPAEAAARAGLEAEAFRTAWAEGEATSTEAAVAYARRARGERKRPSSGWHSLTPTELHVARLAAQGLSNAEIGAKLFMSAGTAKVHLHRIYVKLDLANRAQLTAEFTRRRL